MKFEEVTPEELSLLFINGYKLLELEELEKKMSSVELDEDLPILHFINDDDPVMFFEKRLGEKVVLCYKMNGGLITSSFWHFYVRDGYHDNAKKSYCIFFNLIEGVDACINERLEAKPADKVFDPV